MAHNIQLTAGQATTFATRIYNSYPAGVIAGQTGGWPGVSYGPTPPVPGFVFLASEHKPGTNYYGEAWKNPTTGEVVVVSRGTVPDTRDASANLKIASGDVPASAHDAATFTQRIAEMPGNANSPIISIGHSKAGYEAQFSNATLTQRAIESGGDTSRFVAVTADAAAFGKAAIELFPDGYKAANATNFIAKTDPVSQLTFAAGYTLPGRTVVVPLTGAPDSPTASPDSCSAAAARLATVLDTTRPVAMSPSQIAIGSAVPFMVVAGGLINGVEWTGQAKSAYEGLMQGCNINMPGHSSVALADSLNRYPGDSSNYQLGAKSISEVNREYDAGGLRTQTVMQLTGYAANPSFEALGAVIIKQYIKRNGLGEGEQGQDAQIEAMLSQKMEDVFSDKELTGAQLTEVDGTVYVRLANGEVHWVDPQGGVGFQRFVQNPDGSASLKARYPDGSVQEGTRDAQGNVEISVRDAQGSLLAHKSSDAQGHTVVQAQDPATGEHYFAELDASGGAVSFSGQDEQGRNFQATLPVEAFQPESTVGDDADPAPSPSPAPEPNSYSYTNYLGAAGSKLTPTQQEALASQLDGLHLGGEGALSFITLPGGGTTLILNVDGEVVGEINQGANGYTRLNSVRINADGSVEPYVSYVAPSGQAYTQEKYEQTQSEAQMAQVTGAVGLMNSIIGLQNWGEMSDLQRTAAVVSIYNVVDKLTGGNALPGDLGTATAVLGLLNALDQGNAGGVIYSGLSLVEHLTYDAATKMGLVSDTLGGSFLPGLGFVLALDSGDPVSIASSGLSLMSSLGYIGPWGAVAAVVITLLGGLFADNDQPMLEGQAHAQWDAVGNTVVITDQDAEGGGATAAGWMSGLVHGLQLQLSQTKDANGNPYALIPNLLPAIGYQNDPDGFNLANGAKGFLYLKWTDEQGNSQTRYYDGAGNRGDDSGETLAGDFMQHAQGAIAPAWVVQTTLSHWQQGQGLVLPEEETSLPQELADGIHQTLQALTLALPDAPALQNALIDIDGDGYLERSQWLGANQQILAIDANGDGAIAAGELLHLNGNASLNSLYWLDANNDKLLNASDPAFAALRLWMDVNGDGRSTGETRTLSQAGIAAIDFGSNPPAIVRSDGSRVALTAQTLTADVLGVSYQNVTGGVLQLDEQTNAAAVATLHAVNTREFDGQANHMHGGELDTDGADDARVSINAASGHVVSTTAHTITAQSTQTSTVLADGDGRVQSGAAGTAQAGQAAGGTAGSAAQIRSNAVVFVPAGAAGLGVQTREATAAMVRSADNGLFGAGSSVTPLVALAVGAAVQWPALATAAPQGPAAGNAEATPATGSIDWQVWDGSRVSSAPTGDLLAMPPGTVPVTQTGEHALTSVPRQTVSDIYASNQPLAHGVWAQAAINSVAGSTSSSDPTASAANASDQLASTLPGNSAGGTGSDVLLDFPRTQGEQAAGQEDTGLRFAEALLLANDSTLNSPARPGEPSLRITSVFAPVHGSVSLQINALGATELVFVPDANYHGPASFSYTVSDQYGLSSNASVTLQVAAVNDAPVAVGESASGDEDNTLLFSAASLLANDSDVDSAVDGDVLRITRVGLAEHGQVFLLPDGTVRFVPDANYNGPAQFTYWVGDRDVAQIANGEGYETPATVRLTVLPVNDLPVVTGEVMASDEDIVLDINPALLLANDTDVDTATTNAEPAQVLTITAVGHAQHGSIVLLADGTLRFTPERDYFGAAGFSYTVDDGHGGQVVGQVVVNLAPVNDAPEVLGETVSFNEDEIQTLTQAQLLANDSDVDNPHSDLRIIAVDNATHGTVALNPDGSIRFVPAADYFGPAQFTYTVSDGVGGFTVGTASLDIAPVNDAPRLLGESLALDEDTQARFSISALLANDTDVDNLHADLTITAAGGATHGSVQIVAGEIVFTPDLNFNGQASFTYTVSDGVGGTSQATVNLSFNPVNDAPVANSELIWGKRDVSYTLSQAALLANDTDVESPSNLKISAISNAQHGTATLNANGSVSFTPEAGYAGRGSFDYVVQDPEGATSTATAQIDFSRININPLATDDSFTGYEDVAFSITQAQLLVNDSDADNPATDLRVTAVAGAQNGTVSLDANGTVRFTPAANFYGTASFTYQVSDGEGGSTWAMAQLNVQSVNDGPIIEDIWYGRPIYGQTIQTTSGVDESGFPTTIQTTVTVTSESQARSLLASGQLLGSSGSYYQNGQLRPIGFDNADAFRSDGESGGTVDDVYRQNGRVVAYDPDGDSNLLSFSVGSTPQHGHAWANMYTGATAPEQIDHTQAGSYWIGETGAWQYFSSRGDGYGGSDPFTITVTDSGGASANASVNTAHVGSSIGGGGGKKPVTLDLDGNGLHYIGLDDSKAYFDVNNDGWREHLAWVSAGDGLLVRDIGGDRVIDRFDEISFTSYLAGAKTDLEGLAAFDSNGDGLLSRLDARWQEFGAWRDVNGDGASALGEFRTLDEIGIVQIGLTSDQQIRQVEGVTEFGQSRFTWADGRTGAVGDVALPVDEATRLATTANGPLPTATLAGPQETGSMQADEGLSLPLLGELFIAPAVIPASMPQLTPEQMALLMVQMINTVTGTQDTTPLSSIPIQDEQDPQQAMMTAQAQWEQAAHSQAVPPSGGSA